MRVTRNRSQRTLYLDQSIYIDKIITELRMEEDTYRPVKTPIHGYDALMPAADEDERVDVQTYQKYVGSIMYAMVNTRPDIAFATTKLAQFMSNPTRRHESAVKHLLRYLQSTRDMLLEIVD